MFGPNRPLLKIDRIIACKKALFFSKRWDNFNINSPLFIFWKWLSHPNLPWAVALDELEVFAQVVVGAEADFEDLDFPVELSVRVGIGGVTVPGCGAFPGQGVTGHHLVHFHGWVGSFISTSSCRKMWRNEFISEKKKKKKDKVLFKDWLFCDCIGSSRLILKRRPQWLTSFETPDSFLSENSSEGLSDSLRKNWDIVKTCSIYVYQQKEHSVVVCGDRQHPETTLSKTQAML